MKWNIKEYIFVLAIATLPFQCSQNDTSLKIKKGDHFLLIGNNL